MEIPVVRLSHAFDLPLPLYQTAGAAGVDLHAAIGADVLLAPATRTLVPCGIAVAVPSGFELQVRTRSGYALRSGIVVLNAPGTIDPDFRGEVSVILANLGTDSFVLKRGLRIAQAVLVQTERIRWVEVHALPETVRDGRGFGHTGD